MPQLLQRQSGGQVQKQLVQEFIESVTELGILHPHLVSCIPSPGSPVHPTVPKSTIQLGLCSPAPAELDGNSPQFLQNLQFRFLPGKAVAFPARLQHEQHSQFGSWDGSTWCCAAQGTAAIQNKPSHTEHSWVFSSSSQYLGMGGLLFFFS